MSLLLPHLFSPQSDCDIVLSDYRARVYEANADVQLLVAAIAPTQVVDSRFDVCQTWRRCRSP
uniref:Uncharacterized protein n=1 Tax=Hyaloperonospora arabidopsidis (strain Emoy2) TaxID=559515 RepID=M4BJ88_HYAAE